MELGVGPVEQIRLAEHGDQQAVEPRAHRGERMRVGVEGKQRVEGKLGVSRPLEPVRRLEQRDESHERRRRKRLECADLARNHPRQVHLLRLERRGRVQQVRPENPEARSEERGCLQVDPAGRVQALLKVCQRRGNVRPDLGNGRERRRKNGRDRGRRRRKVGQRGQRRVGRRHGQNVPVRVVQRISRSRRGQTRRRRGPIGLVGRVVGRRVVRGHGFPQRRDVGKQRRDQVERRGADERVGVGDPLAQGGRVGPEREKLGLDRSIDHDGRLDRAQERRNPRDVGKPDQRGTRLVGERHVPEIRREECRDRHQRVVDDDPGVGVERRVERRQHLERGRRLVQLSALDRHIRHRRRRLEQRVLGRPGRRQRPGTSRGACGGRRKRSGRGGKWRRGRENGGSGS